MTKERELAHTYGKLFTIKHGGPEGMEFQYSYMEKLMKNHAGPLYWRPMCL